MQPLKLNVERSFWEKVDVVYTDEEGKRQTGSFRAQYRVANADETNDSDNEDKTLLDLVLLDIDKLELRDKDGQLLEGDELLHAAKVDPILGNALVRTYGVAVQKKPRK